MTPEADIENRREEIQSLIASNDISQAVKWLMDFARDFSDKKDDVNEVIVISATYHRLQAEKRRQSLKFDDFELQLIKLLYAALDFMDSIVEQFGFRSVA